MLSAREGGRRASLEKWAGLGKMSGSTWKGGCPRQREDHYAKAGRHKGTEKNILNYNSRCHQGCVLGCSGIWNECVNSEDLRLGKCKRPLTLCLKKKQKTKKKLYCPRQCGVLGWLKHENHCLVARRKRSEVLWGLRFHHSHSFLS